MSKISQYLFYHDGQFVSCSSSLFHPIYSIILIIFHRAWPCLQSHIRCEFDGDTYRRIAEKYRYGAAHSDNLSLPQNTFLSMRISSTLQELFAKGTIKPYWQKMPKRVRWWTWKIDLIVRNLLIVIWTLSRSIIFLFFKCLHILF